MDTTIGRPSQSKPVWYLIPEREPVYQCHWTRKWVRARDVTWTGAVVPGVKFRHAAAPGYEEARKQHVRWFQENDANCNTCKHLQRVPHPKNSAGFLFGRCTSEQPGLASHPYPDTSTNGVMKFHPDDWMGMPCHCQR